LRQRREDIPLLIDNFIAKYAKMFNKEIRNISSYAMELLMNYDFPGNIRELENIIERSVAMESSNIILPENLTLYSNAADSESKFDIEVTEKGINLNTEMEKIERKMIEKALQRAKGSKKRTAELLNVTFDSLRYRMEKLGIE
jgi:two-component system response regulator PilR (NtrC family)